MKIFFCCGRIFHLVAAPFAFLCLLSFSGCVATTTDVDRLQDSLKTMQKNQADLIVKMEELDKSLVGLKEKLDENQKKMSTLSQKLDNTQSGLGNRMDIIAQLLSAATTHATVQLPSDLFRMAEGDYRAGKIELAVSEFKSFLERYPKSDLSDAAQFYLADCYLSKKDFSQALTEFDKLLSVSIEYRARALLKRAFALEGLNRPPDQKATLQALIKELPDSSEAEAARQIVKEIEEKEKENKKEPPPLQKEKKSPKKTLQNE